ncbi:MAG: HAD family hydrolase [Candidatus Micrarchaeota archaeon]|nr:HAD family hydrolase [Candidatus Micrarchaeota archaeon]
MGIRAIIFDIDGVLADSRRAVVHNTKELMREFGFRVSGKAIRSMSSAHSAESVLLALAPQLSKNRRLLERMLLRLSELTAENLHLVKPTALAAAVPALAKRYRLAAATNRKASARMVLRRLGIEKHFAAVLTLLDAPPKPNPKMLLLAVERLGEKKENVIFVGDNKEDFLAAKAAGIGFVLLDGERKRDCRRFLDTVLAPKKRSGLRS